MRKSHKDKARWKARNAIKRRIAKGIITGTGYGWKNDPLHLSGIKVIYAIDAYLP
jgi:hypothetical protein